MGGGWAVLKLARCWVLAALCALGVTLVLTAGASGAATTTLATCDYVTVSSQEAQFIAPRFKWVVTGDDTAPARIHALNRRVRLLKYFDALFTGQSETGYRVSEYLTDPERMSRLEPTGKRWLLYAMDVTNPEWRATANPFSRALFAEFGAACRARR